MQNGVIMNPCICIGTRNKCINPFRVKAPIYFNAFQYSAAMSPSYRNQSIDLQSKLIDWFLCHGNIAAEYCKSFETNGVTGVKWITL